MSKDLMVVNKNIATATTATEEDEAKLNEAISSNEAQLNQLLDGIDETFILLRNTYPEMAANKAHVLKLIAVTEQELRGKNADHIVDAEQQAAVPERPKTGGKKKCRELFARIARLTHEDKLISRGATEEEIAYMRGVFDEAKSLLDVNDHHGLEFILTTLIAKNTNVTREALVKAKRSKLISLRRQRIDIERSFEGRCHRMYCKDKNSGEVMYLAQAKSELNMLVTRLQRLRVLNQAEFLNG